MQSRSNVLAFVAGILAFTTTLTSAALTFCGNKYCGVDAVCESGKCQCPLAMPMGDPAFRCHTDDTLSCVLIGDPSLVGFGNSLTFLDFPCKYTFSKFDTPLLSRKHNNDPPHSWDVPDPGNDRCRIITHGTNAITPDGLYYLKEVTSIININVGGSSRLESLVVKMSANRATYSYAPYGEVIVEKDDEHGCFLRLMDNTNSIGLSICYVEETKIWSFGIAICGATYINFRAWDGDSNNQPLRPGVSITTNGETALFHPEASEYPQTMCGYPFSDSDDIYHEKCKAAGIKGKRNCAINAFLKNNPPEQPHYCTTALEIYNLCTGEKQKQAINSCGSILSRHGACVIKNGNTVMNIFEACVVAVCANPDSCGTIAASVRHPSDEECLNFKDPC